MKHTTYTNSYELEIDLLKKSIERLRGENKEIKKLLDSTVASNQQMIEDKKIDDIDKIEYIEEFRELSNSVKTLKDTIKELKHVISTLEYSAFKEGDPVQITEEINCMGQRRYLIQKDRKDELGDFYISHYPIR